MAKPSIFSNQYEKQMKKRRNRLIIFVVSLIFLVGIVVIINLSSENPNNVSQKAKEKTTSKNNTNASNTKKTETKNSSTVNAKKSNTAKQNKNTKQEDLFVVTLPDNKTVKVNYEKNGDNKTIKSVDNNDSDIEYNISPAGSEVVVYEKSTQNMLLAKADGSTTNVTKTNYVSGSGESFDKTTVLTQNPSYIWCSSPKFVDEDNIVYISQLPWIESGKPQYIWKYSVKDNSYINTNICGGNIVISNLTDKGIQVSIDNNVQYLKSDGTLSN